MDKRNVKKFTKGEIYTFIDSNNDKSNVSQDQSILIGTRPVMIVKGGEKTSLVVPFTRNSLNKPLGVVHPDGVKSYPAYDMLKTVNNKDLANYLSTVKNPQPIMNLISDYITNEIDYEENSEEIIEDTTVFSSGQIWKKKEGPYFLILKVLGSLSDNKGRFLMTGIVLDQTADDEEDYDILIPWYNRKFHVDIFKTITISSDDINFYQGAINSSLLKEIVFRFTSMFSGELQCPEINMNQIDNMLGKTTDYDPIANRYIPSERSKIKEELDNEEKVKKKRGYTDEEKQFILNSKKLEDIMERFALNQTQAYKLKYYIKTSYKFAK